MILIETCALAALILILAALILTGLETFTQLLDQAERDEAEWKAEQQRELELADALNRRARLRVVPRDDEDPACE